MFSPSHYHSRSTANSSFQGRDMISVFERSCSTIFTANSASRATKAASTPSPGCLPPTPGAYSDRRPGCRFGSIANRPRAGKDYLAAIPLLVYEGYAYEDLPIGKESEETSKRIVAAARSGRHYMHFSNCQNYLRTPTSPPGSSQIPLSKGEAWIQFRRERPMSSQ